MTPFSVYTTSGKILRSGTCQDETFSLQAGPGESVIAEKLNPKLDWVDGGVSAVRPTLSVPASKALAVDENWTLNPIPNGTDVYTDGQLAGTVSDGEMVISFPEAGTWQLELRPPFPYRDATSEVTVI